MSRVPLILVAALLSGVASPVEAGKKPKKHKKQKDDRRVTKKTKANMPRGFVWPPSKNMVAMGDACAAKLDEIGVGYQAAGDVGRVVRPMKPDAEINGVTYTAVYSKNQTFDCQLVLALAVFAPHLSELGVREVKFGSAFRWSKVRVGGKTKNILSRHGLGLALDVVSFVDADGNDHNVKRDYKRGDELLHAIAKRVNDSGQFRILLTPRNDPKSHSDHFHFEANPDYTDIIEGRPSS
jgi:hypothetical protein